MNSNNFSAPVLLLSLLLLVLTSCKSQLPVTPDAPQTASQLAISGAPTSVVAGAVFSLGVQAQRADGTLDDTYTGSISLLKGSGTGTLSGTLTRNAVGGVAAFNDLSVSADGDYTFSVVSGTLQSATTATVTATPALNTSAVKLGITVVTNPIVTAQAFTVKVQAQRADGSVDTAYSGSVSLVKTGGAGTLAGTLVKSAVKGEATFSDLTVSAADTYTLSSSSGSLSVATGTVTATALEVVLKQGTFQNAGYTCTGTFQLVRQANGTVQLEFSSNFSSSFYGGSSVWLSPSYTNPVNKPASLKVGQLTNGSTPKSFSVSGSVEGFTHITILCDGANRNIGYGVLLNP